MHRACIPVLLPVPLRPDTCLVPFCTRCYLQNYFITFLDNWNISLQDQNTPNKWMLQKTLRWLAVAVRVNKLNWERVPYTTGSLKTSLCCSSQQPGKEQTHSSCRQATRRLEECFSPFHLSVSGLLTSQHSSVASAGVKPTPKILGNKRKPTKVELMLRPWRDYSLFSCF